MTLTVNRAALQKAAASAPQQSKFERRDAQAAALHPTSRGRALGNFQWQLERRFRDDAEALQNIRASIRQIDAFAARRGMDDIETGNMLSRVVEYVQFPRDRATQETIAGKTFEAMRLERGSTEQANEAARRSSKFVNDLVTEVPYVGKLVTEHGARCDRQFVEIGARYSEHIT
jgi:hypothetical protein